MIMHGRSGDDRFFGGFRFGGFSSFRAVNLLPRPQMSSRRAAALFALALTRYSAFAASHCFDGALAHTVCFNSSVADGNITFSMTCSPFGLVDRTGWCALGLPYTGTSMGPAEVFWLSALSNGAPSFEDRVNPGGHAASVCAPAQLSHVLAAAADASGTLTATWTRPLELAPTAGYVNISEGAPRAVIAAWSSDLARPGAACNAK